MPGSHTGALLEMESTVIPRRRSRSLDQTARQGRGLTGWCGACESEPTRACFGSFTEDADASYDLACLTVYHWVR